MRSALRFLFVPILAAVLAVCWSGAASAAVVADTPEARLTGISPASGQVVGIAAPVTFTFAAPVTDRAGAERAASVRAGEALPGTFAWLDDTHLRWTSAGTLPASSPISVGFGTQRTEFQTNGGVYAEANMSAHTFTVSIGGQVVRTMPASMGKPGFETPTGTFPVLEKFRSLVFDSRTIGIPLDSPEGYIIDGEWAVRLTWGGVFVHSAPWSVDSQGNANVSHGCINLAPDDAAWYYENVGIGDQVYIHW
ncbi:L,D-transpeptidase [Nocardia sp. AG03]|uniref:L,D-transpeptidase n=1 Tax=Nocardia sp. AG03 TaxID=3025312 RepID=UPI00241894A7|nr:L,D-transpeptidase [Nocardia sp. AG03]